MLLHSHNPFGLHLRIYGLPLKAEIGTLDTLIRALCLIRLGGNADLQLAIGANEHKIDYRLFCPTPLPHNIDFKLV
jgi:hypothetical protein